MAKRKKGTEGKTLVDQREIDKDGQKALASALPSKWVSNRFTEEDIGKDYLIELPKPDGSNLLSGTQCYIQLKSKRAHDFIKEGQFVSLSLEMADLKYWCNELKSPLFVVAVDTTKEIGWWLYLQGYMRGMPNWQKTGKGSLKVHIPTDNVLTDSGKLERAIVAAHHDMLRRGAPQGRRAL